MTLSDATFLYGSAIPAGTARRSAASHAAGAPPSIRLTPINADIVLMAFRVAGDALKLAERLAVMTDANRVAIAEQRRRCRRIVELDLGGMSGEEVRNLIHTGQTVSTLILQVLQRHPRIGASATHQLHAASRQLHGALDILAAPAGQCG